MRPPSALGNEERVLQPNNVLFVTLNGESASQVIETLRRADVGVRAVASLSEAEERLLSREYLVCLVRAASVGDAPLKLLSFCREHAIAVKHIVSVASGSVEDAVRLLRHTLWIHPGHQHARRDLGPDLLRRRLVDQDVVDPAVQLVQHPGGPEADQHQDGQEVRSHRPSEYSTGPAAGSGLKPAGTNIDTHRIEL